MRICDRRFLIIYSGYQNPGSSDFRVPRAAEGQPSILSLDKLSSVRVEHMFQVYKGSDFLFHTTVGRCSRKTTD